MYNDRYNCGPQQVRNLHAGGTPTVLLRLFKATIKVQIEALSEILERPEFKNNQAHDFESVISDSAGTLSINDEEDFPDPDDFVSRLERARGGSSVH